MLVTEFISHAIPTITSGSTVGDALMLMDEMDVTQVPVVDQNKYLGMLRKDDLLDEMEEITIYSILDRVFKGALNEGEHLIYVMNFAVLHHLSVVPVVGKEEEWIGGVNAPDLLKAMVRFTGAETIGAIIVLEMEHKSYSFGEISRLVETNDAFITQFNTYAEPETGLLIATIKVNKLEVSDIIATFQRYEYSIRYFIGEEQYENELKHNYEHLMTYLKM